MYNPTLDTLYSVRDIARIFGLSESRVRYWAQTGFINPSSNQGGKRLYTFRDLVGIRAAKELLESGIPLQRVRRNLLALREALPRMEQPLTKLRVYSDGEHMLVGHRDGDFDPLSGQMLLDFQIEEFSMSVAQIMDIKMVESAAKASDAESSSVSLSNTSLPGRIAPKNDSADPSEAASISAPSVGSDQPAEPEVLVESQEPARGTLLQFNPKDKQAADPEERAEEGSEQTAAEQAVLEQTIAAGTALGSDQLPLEPETAYGWFMRGCACDTDEERTEEAIAAYEQAIELDPSLAAAYTNLGNIFYRRRERDKSLHYYQTACALDPDQAEARYNLANFCEEDGEFDMAIAEYRRALISAPDFSDAHFNLALTLERVGGQVQAIEHWRRYLELTEGECDLEEWRTMAKEHLKLLEQATVAVKVSAAAPVALRLVEEKAPLTPSMAHSEAPPSVEEDPHHLDIDID